ncbi:unannotated protein [freshwater metagenome]|uniref:Unannotated protein n=1 Tax=freshwater metagenome TaxID=449393 RepID=A0A6J7J526_9ZZZZ|nr:4Fe-4S dicluster domain-containing protein [Actinomycetota bacterium]
MRHALPMAQIGPQAEPMARAIGACVHCGFCLPSCPTYVELGEEMDSPRGRIILMKEALEGTIELEAALPHVDRCLGCLACVSACPSGVQYGELLTPFRAYAEPRRKRGVLERVQRRLVLQTLPYPRRLRLAARAARLARPVARVLPTSLATMLRLLPRELPAAQPLPHIVPAEGERRARVALLAGCAQQVLDPDITAAAIRVLARNGVEVVIPADQGCCGALASHTGAAAQARAHARATMAAFPRDVDAVITTAAGCGSGMQEYGTLLLGEPDHDDAAQFAGGVVDVCAFLAELGLREAPATRAPVTVAYQDACHLAHAQGVHSAPRQLLDAIVGVTLIEVPEAELCCGSAGTYNVEQPEIAAALGRRKAVNLSATGAHVVASGNIGCMTQISTHLSELGHDLPVLHTIQLLDRAYARTM